MATVSYYRTLGCVAALLLSATATMAQDKPAAPAAEPALPPEPAPLSASTGTVTPGAWNHPGFIQAANLFNQTLTAYQAQLKKPDPANPALVSGIALPLGSSLNWPHEKSMAVCPRVTSAKRSISTRSPAFTGDRVRMCLMVLCPVARVMV